MGIRHRGIGMIVATSAVAQGRKWFSNVAARRSGVGWDCRVDRQPAATALAFERDAAAIALDVHLKDGGVMDEAVDDSDRHSLIGEDLAPLSKGLVGSDEEGSPLVPGADEFKERAGFGGAVAVCVGIDCAFSGWLRILDQAARSIGLSVSFWVRVCHPSTLRIVI
jgi:hypothetical protein